MCVCVCSCVYIWVYARVPVLARVFPSLGYLFTISFSPFFPANRSPGIVVVSSINVTIGQEVRFTVRASDPDGDTVNLKLVTAPPRGATFNTVTGIFTWTPQDREYVNIT